MQIDLSAKGVDIGEDLRELIERRLGFALGRFAGRFGRVRVRLEEDDGTRGGSDTRCRISVEIQGIGDVVVEDIDSDVRTAVSRAADRVGRTVARRLDRVVSARRSRAASPRGKD